MTTSKLIDVSGFLAELRKEGSLIHQKDMMRVLEEFSHHCDAQANKSRSIEGFDEISTKFSKASKHCKNAANLLKSY